MKKKLLSVKNKKINKLNEHYDLLSELVPRKQYFEFINELVDYNVITQCEMKSAINNYIKISHINFNENFKNKILKSYLQYMKKEKRLYLLSRLFLLLIHFVSEEKAFQIMNFVRNNNDITDVDFIKLFSKLSPKEKIPAIYQKINNVNNEKFSKFHKFEFCDKRLYVFDSLQLNYVKLFEKMNDTKYSNRDKIYQDFRYLDIGCGNGKKTELFANLCKIPLNKVYCADISEWGPYKKNKKFKFHFQEIYQDNLLQFPDKHFQFITCFLTLHHVDKLPILFKEINRVLDDKGLFLIIEHDAFNIEDNLIINLQHMLYSYMRDGIKDEGYYKNFIKNSGTNFYLNFLEWDFIMKNNGFTYLKGNMINEDFSHVSSYDNQFYSFYKKSI